ncbi:hypothetical protein AQUCO_00200113v1 [Aquilegia coerulea]|uniref:Uncharacterized protein n=1 Tax=Aquilegia coerulea TaxID=218851 RepID=A0A2G5F1N9_AQUCA|nr:hypothetical protein AQUCO_00200113v1 [Aquilegia coerulea]
MVSLKLIFLMFFLITTFSFDVEASRIEPKYVSDKIESSTIKPSWIPVNCPVQHPTCRTCCRCGTTSSGEIKCVECCPFSE